MGYGKDSHYGNIIARTGYGRSSKYGLAELGIPQDVINYIARVIADGGTVPDQAKLVSTVKALMAAGLWDSCVFCAMPIAGVKKDGNQFVSKMYDLKGNADVSQATGTAQPKYDNGSLLYDGSDDKLQMSTLFNGATSFTILTQVKFTTSNDRDVFFGNYSTNINDFNIERTATNGIRFYWAKNGAINDITTSANVITTGVLYNIGIVRDTISSTKNVRIYVENSVVKQADVSLPDISPTVKHYLGGDSRDGNTCLKGNIRTSAIYYYPMTTAEVVAYNNCISGA